MEKRCCFNLSPVRKILIDPEIRAIDLLNLQQDLLRELLIGGLRRRGTVAQHLDKRRTVEQPQNRGATVRRLRVPLKIQA